MDHNEKQTTSSRAKWPGHSFGTSRKGRSWFKHHLSKVGISLRPIEQRNNYKITIEDFYQRNSIVISYLANPFYEPQKNYFGHEINMRTNAYHLQNICT